jgi:hypothetical protein
MIAIFNAAQDSLAVDSRRLWQFMTPTLVAIGYRLGVLISIASSKLERQFATFADVPYHEPRSRQQWEQLWRAEPNSSRQGRYEDHEASVETGPAGPNQAALAGLARKARTPSMKASICGSVPMVTRHQFS